MRKVLNVLLIVALVVSLAGCMGNKADGEKSQVGINNNEINKESEKESEDFTGGSVNKIQKLKFGELVDIKENNNMLIIKAKIEPSYSNKTTVNQNGFNIEDIILNKGGDVFDEIQYWAVADMSDGSEEKVISFTLKKKHIDDIKDKQLVGNKIVDNADDVWILPSLLN
ncbi:MAG: hypothetical protein RR460_04460 [Clostridium sp.]